MTFTTEVAGGHGLWPTDVFATSLFAEKCGKHVYACSVPPVAMVSQPRVVWSRLALAR